MESEVSTTFLLPFNSFLKFKPVYHYSLELHSVDTAKAPKPHQLKGDVAVVGWGTLGRNSPQILCQERNGNLLSFSFPLNPMFSGPSPSKVIIIIASGREPVTRHYSKVESHPVSQPLDGEREQNQNPSISNVDNQWRREQRTCLPPNTLYAMLFIGSLGLYF